MNALRHLRADERGSISMLAVVMAFAVITMIGLAVDGGGKIRAIEHADSLAAEAARAAGQAIDVPQAVEGGTKVVDPDGAAEAARRYLAAAGATGTVTVSADRTRVTVTVTVVYHTVFLGAIGISSFTVTRQVTAVLIAT